MDIVNIATLSTEEKKVHLQQCIATAMSGRNYPGSRDYDFALGVKNPEFLGTYSQLIRNYELLKSRGAMDNDVRKAFDEQFAAALMSFPGYINELQEEMQAQAGRRF